MVNLIKKAFYTGLGLAVLTKEKAEELVKEIAQQAKLSEHEGKELVDSLMKQSDQARNRFPGQGRRGGAGGRQPAAPGDPGRGRGPAGEGRGAVGEGRPGRRGVAETVAAVRPACAQSG